MPLTNLQDPALATLARSANDLNASTQLSIDLKVGRGIRVVTLSQHNISQSGQVKVTASNDSGFSTLAYDSGWVDAWPVFFAPGSVPWGTPGLWTGTFSAEEADDYTMQFVHVLTTAIWARYWKIEIDDEANPAGYVELSRASLWSAWQPDTNMGYGATVGWDTDTPADRSLSGVDYYDRRTPRRVVQFTLPLIPEATALTKPFEMMRKLGLDDHLFFVFDPDDDQAEMFRRSFLATIRELSPLEYSIYAYNSQVFALKEVL